MGINNIQEGRVKPRPPSHSAANSQLSFSTLNFYKCFTRSFSSARLAEFQEPEVTCQVSGDATHT